MAFNWFKKKEKKLQSAKADEVQAVNGQAEAASAPSIPAASSDAVLKRFYISEKAARAGTYNQYAFEVARTATKTQIRDAVEKSYKVKVVGINTISLPSKQRRVGRYIGTKSAIKKAIVTLKEGSTIAQAKP